MNSLGDAPIVIVRKKKRGHGGHHGGAWKVAYADFVTAMMAFFLVMWLVTQSAAVKAAVASYFKDPGLFEYNKSMGLIGGGAMGIDPGSVRPPSGSGEKEFDDRETLQRAAQHIREMLSQAPEFKTLRDQIQIQVTPDGLRIELVEQTDSTFFDTGSAVLRGDAEKAIVVIARELGRLRSPIVVEGHTDSRPYTATDRYTNWELSTDRANAARRVMEHGGLHAAQVRGVRGYADTQLRFPNDPLDPRNRRVTIVVQSMEGQSAT